MSPEEEWLKNQKMGWCRQNAWLTENGCKQRKKIELKSYAETRYRDVSGSALMGCDGCAGLDLSREREALPDPVSLPPKAEKKSFFIEEKEMTKKICNEPGCDKIMHSRGKCWKHVKSVLGINPATGKKLATADLEGDTTVATEKMAKDQVEEGRDEPKPASVDGLVRAALAGLVADTQPFALSAAEVRRNETSIFDESQNTNGTTERTSEDLYTVSPFLAVGIEIGKLVTTKNRVYGDSFKKCAEYMKLLYPDGVRPDQYGDMLGLVRMFDKQMRIATDRDALGESPWSDIAGYGILGEARVRGL